LVAKSGVIALYKNIGKDCTGRPIWSPPFNQYPYF